MRASRVRCVEKRTSKTGRQSVGGNNTGLTSLSLQHEHHSHSINRRVPFSAPPCQIRELLSFYKFDGDEIPLVAGSALAAVEGRDKEVGEDAIMELMEAVDTHIPTPTRGIFSQLHLHTLHPRCCVECPLFLSNAREEVGLCCGC